jgi:4-amino-4-deoxy-L-arabinose transferase-like glycosyltransferase
MTIADRSSRREALVILALTLLGAGLRFWSFGDLGLTHFDEGIYALAGLWSVSRGGLASLDPTLIPYAPPGYPILVGLSYLVFGVADVSAIVVATGCAVATIPVAGWLGRRTFGPGAGAEASAFAAMSMAHVAFSRKALTDAPFLLAWLLALGLGQRFLEAPRLGRAVAMGVAVGLAQNLKYNGWLAGAIIILTALLGLIVRREDRHVGSIARTFGFGLIGAAVAALAYGPWYGFVERQEGGYAGLVRHHRGYLGGISSWYPHWEQQIAQVAALSGGLFWNFGTWCVAWLGCALSANGLALVVPGTRWGWTRFRLGLLAGATALAGIASLPWWAGLIALPWLLIEARPAPRLVGVSWLYMSILTPFYYPYARLWLPLHAAGWLILAWAIVRLGPFAREVRVFPDESPVCDVWALRRPKAWALALFACLVLAHEFGRVPPKAIPLARFFRPTTFFRNLTADLVKSSIFPPSEGIGVRVLARRALVFYLVVQGNIPVRIEPTLEDLVKPGRERDWVIVDHAMDRRTLTHMPQVQGQDIIPIRFRPPGMTWDDVLDPVTLLDVFPESVRRESSASPRRVQVELHPPLTR